MTETDLNSSVYHYQKGYVDGYKRCMNHNLTKYDTNHNYFMCVLFLILIISIILIIIYNRDFLRMISIARDE